MKLGKRSIILILPAMSVGYFLAFLGMYHSQREMLIETETSSAQMQVSELSNAIHHYSSLASNYLYALNLYALNQTRHFGALAEAREGALRSMGMRTEDHTTVAVLHRNGDLQYFRDGRRAPTDELEEHYRDQINTLYNAGVNGDKGDKYDAAFFGGERPTLSFARVIDGPHPDHITPADSSTAVAVLVSLEAHRLREKRAAIISDGRQITWRKPAPADQAHPLRIVAQEDVAPFGRLSVIVPGASIAHKLDEVKYALAIALIAVGIISGIMLSYLIWHFITRPIHQLERDLSAIDHNSAATLKAYHSQDEVGRLGRTFVHLYEDLRKSYQITRDMAERDGLTRLYNRRMFHHHMDRLLQRAEESGGKVALLYIDVDNFKFINDTYGHSVGDELLRTFADRLTEILRPGDIIHSGSADNAEECAARLAGDEFAVLLSGFADEEAPRRVADRILDICDGTALTESVRFCTSLSIGVACFPNDASNAAELISNADTAMYQAKNSGKNRYSFYSMELALQSRRVVDIETQLKQLKLDEFSLDYMPIVEARTHCIVAVEALIRWHSPTLGQVSPTEFIPIAESIGAFRDIDLWVILQASSDLSALQRVLGEQLKMSVNVSAAELESRDFLDEITALVGAQRIQPEHFELEITETFHVHKRSDSEEILRQLGALGFSISIDDFGTGFTSLIQLVEYPVDKIKLDKSFIERVIARERIAIITSLVEFCKSQNFSITAEGVETAEQVTTLRQAGCDYLQGYHFYKPMPLDKLIVEIALRGTQPGHHEHGQPARNTPTTTSPAPVAVPHLAWSAPDRDAASFPAAHTPLP